MKAWPNRQECRGHDHHLGCGFSDKTDETAFIRSCTALQLLDRVFLTFTVGVLSSKKALEALQRFVHTIVFSELISGPMRTHVCRVLCTVRSMRNQICEKCLSL